MADNSKTKLPYLNKLELELLTPQQAKQLNQFDQDQYRRNKVYEGRTIPVERRILEDRTPNGSIDSDDRWCKLMSDKVIGKELSERQCQLLMMVDGGYTYKEIAKTLGVSVRTIDNELSQMRGRGKENAPPR